MDENLIYTAWEGGLLTIRPKDGYRMLCMKTGTYFSEAICREKDAKSFVSVKTEASE